MAGRSRLDDQEVRALAAAFGLPALTAWGEIAAGTINQNHWVEAGGRRWFLRVNQGKSEDDVRFEAGLVRALAAAGVATPCPEPTPAGDPLVPHRGLWVSLFPWVDGAHRAPADVTVADAAEVGRALARLHLAGAPLAQRFDREGIYTTRHIAGRVEGLDRDPRAAADPALTLALAEARAELDWLDERAGERARAPRGIIHGDLFRDNVLFGAGGQVWLLDFEQASAGSLVYDLAVCLNAWCFDGAFAPALVRALVDGYRSTRALGADEAALLAVEVRAAAMRFMVTRITDVYLPGAALEGKDFRRYLERLAAWRALGAGGLATWLGAA